MLPFVQHEPAIRIDPPISPPGVPALFSESNAFVMLLGLLTMALSTKLAMPSFRREPILYGLLNGPTLATAPGVSERSLAAMPLRAYRPQRLPILVRQLHHEIAISRLAPLVAVNAANPSLAVVVDLDKRLMAVRAVHEMCTQTIRNLSATLKPGSISTLCFRCAGAYLQQS